MDVGATAILVVVDFLIICLCGLTIGVPAPRWPDRWLNEDRGPLRLRSFDRVDFYRGLHVQWLISKLPDGGSWTGGESKSSLYGMDEASLRRYLIEVRRAEWVHVLMSFSWVPLVFFNPLWLLLLYMAFVIGINAPFLMILRYNRVRLTRILGRLSPAPRASAAGEGRGIRHDDGVIAEPDHL